MIGLTVSSEQIASLAGKIMLHDGCLLAQTEERNQCNATSYSLRVSIYVLLLL